MQRRLMLAAALLVFLAGTGACGRTDESVGPTAVRSMTGQWYVNLYVSLRDRAGAEDWLPILPSLRVVPNEVLGFVCNGALTVTAQNDRIFEGAMWLVSEKHVQPYCPPIGLRDQGGTIDRYDRISMTLGNRGLPDCSHVSGDATAFYGTFVTKLANCSECADIVLESTPEFMTCTWRGSSYGIPLERTYNAERVEMLRLRYAAIQ